MMIKELESLTIFCEIIVSKKRCIILLLSKYIKKREKASHRFLSLVLPIAALKLNISRKSHVFNTYIVCPTFALVYCTLKSCALNTFQDRLLFPFSRTYLLIYILLLNLLWKLSTAANNKQLKTGLELEYSKIIKVRNILKPTHDIS